MENVISAALNLASSLEENTTVVHAEKLFVMDIQKISRKFTDGHFIKHKVPQTHFANAINV